MRLFFIYLIILSSVACSTTYQNQSIEGQLFPTVTGENLEQESVNIPADFNNKVTLLLVGYKQDSQFDIDRWLIGLDMTNTVVDTYELPTIQGLLPRMFSTYIDNGMRRGIPKALWKGVVTVYKDGDAIQQFTGNVDANNARVILLDENAKIVYFYDDGFSVKALNKLRAKLNQHQKTKAL